MTLSSSQISPKFLEELKLFLPQEEVAKFVDVCFRPLKKSIRFVLHKWDVEWLKRYLESKGWKFTSSWFLDDDRFPEDIFYVDRDDTSIPLGNTFVHKAGYIYVQEVAAALAARALDLKENDLVLDMSAAPWGKATQIADYLLFLSKQKAGFVVANDVSKPRIKKMAYNVNRIGAYNIGLTAFNGFAFGKNLPEFFDHVLLDAPCSGEGTWYKSATALKFWHKEQIKKLMWTQFQLMVSALKTLKVGGSFVYSTCTLNPYENETNVARLLKQYKGVVELEDIKFLKTDPGIAFVGEEKILDVDEAKKLRRLWPHRQGSWGFFIARFRKIGSLPIRWGEGLQPKNPFKLDMSKALQERVKKYLADGWGIKLDQDAFFVASKELVYITSKKFLETKELIGFEKIWIPIIKRTRGYVRPLHQMGNILGGGAKKNVWEITDEQAQQYALGKDLPAPEGFEDWAYIVLRRAWRGFSVGKISQGVVKNKMGM